MTKDGEWILDVQFATHTAHQCYIYKVIEMNITSEYCISGGCLFKVLRITSGVLKVKVTILSGLPGMVIQKHACLLGSACLFTY